jgi:hypothetical protein
MDRFRRRGAGDSGVWGGRAFIGDKKRSNRSGLIYCQTISRDTVQPFCRVGTLLNSNMRLSDRSDSRSSTNDLISRSGADTFIFTLYRFSQRRIELDTHTVLHPHGITEGSDGICSNMIGMKVALS